LIRGQIRSNLWLSTEHVSFISSICLRDLAVWHPCLRPYGRTFQTLQMSDIAGLTRAEINPRATKQRSMNRALSAQSRLAPALFCSPQIDLRVDVARNEPML
jgi:hypothetical protein